jgi:hypothetical protein
MQELAADAYEKGCLHDPMISQFYQFFIYNVWLTH